MFFKSSQQKKLLKKAHDLISMAKKVIAYRKDILALEDLEEIHFAQAELEKNANKKNSATEAEIKKSWDRLDKILKKCGGNIYPLRFLTENIEMILVAAILAIGIRTFFLQPFEIPTNSMYPTYNGMTSKIYSVEEQIPSFAQKLYRKITLGATYYTIPSSNTGKLEIPLFEPNDMLSRYGYIQFKKVKGRKFFGLLPTALREYTFYVNGVPQSIRVPFEFSLDNVVKKAYFPELEDFSEVITEASIENRISMAPSGPIVETDVTVKTGEPLLSFDLLTGDKLFVDRFSYHFRKPRVGDPVVFRTINVPGLREDKYFIKHLVGVEGDTLEIINGDLIRNGKPIEGTKAFELNRQRLGEYRGYQATRRLGPGEKEYIPEGHFYAIGDNSYHSGDSRHWGFVPNKEAVGRAFFIFYPFSHRWGSAE